ncbi:DinB family protein [Pseudomonas sp. NFX15]|uniref:DinB family protein n=1 Tax=Pseudomonas sp. NFX15 TaxID=2816958 RepID=UPI003B8C2FB4
MHRPHHVCLMATYNEWMNAKLYQVASSLSDEALAVDRNAFFGSILGTLNHLVAGDTVWLKRFATHPANYPALEPIRLRPAPTNLRALLFSNIRELSAHRAWLDRLIIEWAGSITEPDLDLSLKYSNTQGVPADRNFYALVMHFFNHQTHHRGQVTTLLTQAGVDVGDTDLLFLIPSQPLVP